MSSSSVHAAAAGVLLALTCALAPARAAVDLATLQVTPQRGQSAEQARRDRYECHNWAVEQTGVVPAPAPDPEEVKEAARARRAERWARVLTGAAIGASVGSFAQAVDYDYSDNVVLQGAAVGAIVGAATGAKKRDSADGEDEAAGEYLRALSACLEGRGYTVVAPSGEGA
jgi:hypothetical protein